MERIDVNIPLKVAYRETVAPSLREAFGYSSSMAIPRIEKIVVNVGLGRFLKEDSRVDEILRALSDITGQKAVLTRARKAIAGFKIREGLAVGARVTLRGARMWDFLDRLVKTTLPRIRDFQGFAPSIVDGSGNVNIGLREHSVFPEVIPEKIQTLFGLQITMVTTAQKREEGLALAKKLGFPIREH